MCWAHLYFSGHQSKIILWGKRRHDEQFIFYGGYCNVPYGTVLDDGIKTKVVMMGVYNIGGLVLVMEEEVKYPIGGTTSEVK